MLINMVILIAMIHTTTKTTTTVVNFWTMMSKNVTVMNIRMMKVIKNDEDSNGNDNESCDDDNKYISDEKTEHIIHITTQNMDNKSIKIKKGSTERTKNRSTYDGNEENNTRSTRKRTIAEIREKYDDRAERDGVRNKRSGDGEVVVISDDDEPEQEIKINNENVRTRNHTRTVHVDEIDTVAIQNEDDIIAISTSSNDEMQMV